MSLPRARAMFRSWGQEEGGILRFHRDNFKVELDSWQEDALLLFESRRSEDRRISLQACVGPGKSAVLAWCGWWFLGTQGQLDEHPKGLVTAITGDNLQANLWSEYAKWQARSPYLSREFTWTSTAIFSNSFPATWRLEARSWPKSANPEQQGQTFSGLHAKYVLVQVDESGNVPPTVLRAAEQALSRCTFGKIIQAGNPTSITGMLHAAATHLRSQWQVLRITGDPDDPAAWVNSARVGPGPKAWAAEQIATYGRSNPWVRTQILGQFPEASINALLGIEDVEAAIARAYEPSDYEWQQKRLGVDVARFGDDRTVIFPRQGLRAFLPKVMRNARTTDIAARVARLYAKWGEGDVLVFVDDTGHWGHGVIDQLHVAGIPHVPVVYHAKAIDPRYKNRTAEMHLKLAEWVKRGGQLPNDPELVPELTERTYTFHQGQFVLEDKDIVKRRLGRSPDKADALAQTFAIEDMPRRVGSQHASVGRAVTMDSLPDGGLRDYWGRR